MRALVAAFGVWVVALLAACFNPTFDNPACGPAGECPANHTCVQGVCRAMGQEIDAADGDDGDPGDGAGSVDAPDDGGGDADNTDADNTDAPAGCSQGTCAGQVLQCTNCIDDDADGLIDERDPDCLGPCDNDEGRLTLNVIGEAQGCSQDCYFDANSGPGNDGCRWDLRCDTGSGGNGCPYNPGLVGGSSCPLNQTGLCMATCLPVTPNGCDCFGCCLIPGQKQAVLIGSRAGATGMATCERDRLFDQTQCMPCDIQQDCFNPCDSANCELCWGETALSGACIGQQMCPAGHNQCGLPGQPSCVNGEACVSGCCQPSPI